MGQAQDAMTQRRHLRAELRRARNAAGLKQREVAEAMDWSLSKLIRIENGSVGISTTDLKALLQYYNVTDPSEVDRFVAMGRSSKEPPAAWWTKYRAATSRQFLTFLSYENSTSLIQQFEPLLIPGLLQEEDYARAVLAAYGGPASEERMTEWLELRMRRQQELFERPRPPEMVFVIDEAALHRAIASRAVMRRQLRRLKEAAELPFVTIEVVPFTAGAHPGMKGPFVIMEFSDFEEDVLYLENSMGTMISRDDPEEISSRRDAFAELRALAGTVDPIETIDTIMERLSMERLS